MAGGFLTQADLNRQKDKAISIGAASVEAFYSEVAEGFGRALFFACMRTWGSGPISTVSRLNTDARSQIANAWRWHGKLAGVLLKRQGSDFTPIFLHCKATAKPLTQQGDFYVDFEELRKELGYERN